jgi:hypothetical protein
MTNKKKGKGKGRETGEKGKMSLETLNSFRRANGKPPLESLPPHFIPDVALAPSLVSLSPHEGAPLKGSPRTAPLKELPLEEEDAQATPEEETVLDTTLDASEEEDASELYWGNDTVIASALLLGMNKLEGTATSEELASLPLDQWTFDEQPQTKSAKSGHDGLVLGWLTHGHVAIPGSN